EISDDAYTNTGTLPVNVIYTIVPVSAAGCQGPSATVTVAVNPEPVLLSTLSTSVCSDVASGITLDDDGSTVNAATFNITGITMNGLVASAGSPVTGSGFSAAEIFNDAYTNNGGGPVNVIYAVEPVSAAGCKGNSVNVVLTVNPDPVLTSTLNATVCSNQASGITLDDNGSSVNAATFNLTAINMNGLVVSAGGPVTGIGFSDTEILDDAYTNTSLNPVNVVYTIVAVSAGGCLGNAVNVTVTVNPGPVLSGTLNTSVCSDVATGITLDDNGSSVNAATFNITGINLNGLVASAGGPVT